VCGNCVGVVEGVGRLKCSVWQRMVRPSLGVRGRVLSLSIARIPRPPENDGSIGEETNKGKALQC
jgi:hypothetical protein